MLWQYQQLAWSPETPPPPVVPDAGYARDSELTLFQRARRAAWAFAAATAVSVLPAFTPEPVVESFCPVPTSKPQIQIVESVQPLEPSLYVTPVTDWIPETEQSTRRKNPAAHFQSRLVIEPSLIFAESLGWIPPTNQPTRRKVPAPHTFYVRSLEPTVFTPFNLGWFVDPRIPAEFPKQYPVRVGWYDRPLEPSLVIEQSPTWHQQPQIPRRRPPRPITTGAAPSWSFPQSLDWQVRAEVPVRRNPLTDTRTFFAFPPSELEGGLIDIDLPAIVRARPWRPATETKQPTRAPEPIDFIGLHEVPRPRTKPRTPAGVVLPPTVPTVEPFIVDVSQPVPAAPRHWIQTSPAVFVHTPETAQIRWWQPASEPTRRRESASLGWFTLPERVVVVAPSDGGYRSMFAFWIGGVGPNPGGVVIHADPFAGVVLLCQADPSGAEACQVAWSGAVACMADTSGPQAIQIT